MTQKDVIYKIQLKPMENLMKIQNLVKRVLSQPPLLFRTLKTEASIHEICLSYICKALNLGHAFILVLILAYIWSCLQTPQILVSEVLKYRLCQKKLYNFQVFIMEQVNKAQQQHSHGLKHNIPVCKKVFKWYHSMVKCKSYGPLSNEW